MDTRYAELARAMVASKEAPAKLVKSAWALMAGSRAGRLAFSRMIGRFVPYTGTIRPEIEALAAGHAAVRIRDAADLRNHLGSIHAAVLFNLVELTANIAVSATMPDDARFIVSTMRIDYLKKARGAILATCDVPPIATNERREVEVVVELRDASNEVVSRGFVTTLVGPARRA